MFYSDETGTYVKLDSNGQAYGNTLDLACLGCHWYWSIEHVYETARNIHSEGLYAEALPDDLKPSEFRMCQNYPNPFNPSTTIEFSVSSEGIVYLEVFDITGRKIITLFNEHVQSGSYTVEFNGDNLPSGLYFYKLTSGSDSITNKMLLIK